MQASPKSLKGTVASPAVQIHLLKCHKDLFRTDILRPQIGGPASNMRNMVQVSSILASTYHRPPKVSIST